MKAQLIVERSKESFNAVVNTYLELGYGPHGVVNFSYDEEGKMQYALLVVKPDGVADTTPVNAELEEVLSKLGKGVMDVVGPLLASKVFKKNV